MIPNKVCPILLRHHGANAEVLAFEHPLAGNQLVKGSIEADESIEAAALRELAEESGIDRAVAFRRLGVWDAAYDGQVWAFIECKPMDEQPDAWVHRAGDDGGHLFRFFWHPLWLPGDQDRWHKVFQNALTFVRAAFERVGAVADASFTRSPQHDD